MPKKDIYIILVLVAALAVIGVVYMYYERQLNAIEQKIVNGQPS